MNLTDEHQIQEHLVDACMDADDPKVELIKLLCGGTAPAAAPLRKDGKPLFNGTRTDGWGKAAMCKAAATVDNDPDAQYWLGRRFLEGRTVRQDERQGVIWLRKAAAAGSYPAQCHLGKHFNRKMVNQGRVAAGGKYPVSKKEAERQAKRAKALAKAEEAEKEQAAHVAKQKADEEANKQAEIAAQKAAVEAADKKAAEEAAAKEAAAAAAAAKQRRLEKRSLAQADGTGAQLEPRTQPEMAAAAAGAEAGAIEEAVPPPRGTAGSITSNGV